MKSLQNEWVRFKDSKNVLQEILGNGGWNLLPLHGEIYNEINHFDVMS